MVVTVSGGGGEMVVMLAGGCGCRGDGGGDRMQWCAGEMVVVERSQWL